MKLLVNALYRIIVLRLSRYVFKNQKHDHIGIVLEKRERTILAAEGNVNNISGIIEQSIDEHIRAYIRIPDGYRYREEK